MNRDRRSKKASRVERRLYISIYDKKQTREKEKKRAEEGKKKRGKEKKRNDKIKT